MRDLIDRKAFYEELNKSSVRNNFQEDDFAYIQHLLFIQPSVSEPKASEWISVKDRLPNEEGRYLCNVDAPYHEVRLMDFHFKRKYVDKHCNKWTDTAGNPVETSFVLYWMKLPEKPKGGNE